MKMAILPETDSRAYNKKVRPCTLKVGDIILRAAGYVQKGV